MSHPFSILNSSWSLVGGTQCGNFTIPSFKNCSSKFHSSKLLFFLSFSFFAPQSFFLLYIWVVTEVCCSISVQLSSSMMTSSNGNIFRVTGPLCGEFTGPGEFPTQRPVTRSFDVFFDPRVNKRLSKQPWGWWFETPSWSLWRQCNAMISQHSGYPRVFVFVNLIFFEPLLTCKCVSEWLSLTAFLEQRTARSI